MIVPSNCDQADIDFIESLVPEEGRDEAIVSTFMVITFWIDTNGEERWRLYCQSDSSIKEPVALLRLAEDELLTRAHSRRDI